MMNVASGVYGMMISGRQYLKDFDITQGYDIYNWNPRMEAGTAVTAW